MGINKYGVVVLRKSKIIFDYKAKISYKKIEYINNFSDIQHDSIREAIKLLDIDFPLDLSYTADIPSRSGLGSSSTFLVALLHGLYTLNNINISPRQLANDANYIERDVLLESGGHQDPIWAAFGGLDAIEFNHTQFQVNSIYYPPGFDTYLEQSLCLIYTSIPRCGTGSDVTKSYSSDHNHQLRILDIAKESIQYFNSGQIEKIGRLLNTSWKEKKHISSKISSPALDSIIEFGLKNGAYGAKLLGAGGGGFVAFLIDGNYRQQFIEKISRINSLKVIPIKIDWNGSTIVYRTEHSKESENEKVAYYWSKWIYS
jgi:D-glycero-alpha-D-manno-heptose-7-phosphate kinase